MDRFWSKVRKPDNEDSDECWYWTAGTSSSYGRFYYEGRHRQAHHVAYWLEVGLIPEGMELDHVCHSRDKSCPGGRSCQHRVCVRPDHLEPVPKRTNILRGRSESARHAVKTHCDNGHEFTPENTYLWEGARYCRACRAEASSRLIRSRVVTGQTVTAQCRTCGTDYESVRGFASSNIKFCSEDCRKEARRLSIKRYKKRQQQIRRRNRPD